MNNDNLPLDQFLTFRLSRLQWRLNAQAGRILKERAGLTLTQWRVVALVRSREPASAAELVRISSMDKGLFSRNVNVLIRKGIVKRTENRDDHRVQDLELTDSGHRLHDSTIPHMRRRQRRLLATMSDREREVLYRILGRLETAAGPGGPGG